LLREERFLLGKIQFKILFGILLVYRVGENSLFSCTILLLNVGISRRLGGSVMQTERRGGDARGRLSERNLEKTLTNERASDENQTANDHQKGIGPRPTASRVKQGSFREA
jgi:hypothetical protein